jgi:protein farnesyltransferase subunit beta
VHALLSLIPTLSLSLSIAAAAAAHVIAAQAERCDLDAQRRWLLKMQTSLEGGFRGRTNKLVDACYSYWQGAAFSVLALIEARAGDLGDCHQDRSSLPSDLNGPALQRYILHCAQQTEGGLRGA